MTCPSNDEYVTTLSAVWVALTIRRASSGRASFRKPVNDNGTLYGIN